MKFAEFNGNPDILSQMDGGLYGLILSEIGCGPMDGGCVIYARALQLAFGGEIYCLIGSPQKGTKSNIALHAFLLVGNRAIDYCNDSNQKRLSEYFQKEELDFAGGKISGFRLMTPSDLEDAPRNEELSVELAKILKEQDESRFY